MTKKPLKPITIKKRLNMLRTRYNECVSMIEQEKEKLRDRCEHDWHYNGDPSGGSDSHYSCNVCGKIKRRKNFM